MSDIKIIFKLNELTNLEKVQSFIKQQRGVNYVEMSRNDDKIKAHLDSHQINPVALSTQVINRYQPERITTAKI